MNMKKITAAVAAAAILAVAAPVTGVLTDPLSVTASAESYDEHGLQIEDNVLVKASKDVTDVVIPDGVTEIGRAAFFGCTSLTSVTIPDSVTKIGDTAFDGCSSLTSLTIPNSVTEIGFSAFDSCSSLTSVTIPNSVTTIGGYAFFACKSLTSVTIGDSVTEIGGSAFKSCTSLTSITIPASVTTIGGYAFESCTSLISIDVDSDNANYSSADGVLFNKDKTSLIYYPKPKESTSYAIPDGVTTIVNSAFYRCTHLTNITIPNSVTTIGDIAFSECTSLTSVTIGNSVTEIGDYAFDGCTSLTSVMIPDSVTKIGWASFRNCTSLTSLTIPASVTKISEAAFNRCTNLTSIEVDDNNPNYYSSADGVLFNKDKTSLVCCPGGKAGTYTIPDSVTEIIVGAFDGCESLTSVTIPDSVTMIGTGAFINCTSLTTIYGVKDSYAETYANENGYTFNAVSVPFNDAKTDITVEGVFPEGTTLSTEENKVSDSKYNFEITLTDKEGNKVQPDGKATVKIPLPETLKNAETIYVYRLEGDKYISYNAAVENGYVVFETDHFSTYIVTTEKLESTSTPSDKDNPDTGVAAIATAVGVAALAGAAVLVARKKRK